MTIVMSETSNKFKRKRENCDNDNELIKKRRLNNIGQSATSAKNLANNRLKKLKDTIQADLKSRNANNLPTTSIPCTDSASDIKNKKYSNSQNYEKFEDKTATLNADFLQTKKSALHVTQNLKKSDLKDTYIEKKLPINKEEYNSFSPTPQVTKKNIANIRLQKIKKALNEDKSFANISDTNSVNESASNIEIVPNCKKETTIREERVSGFKRSHSNISISDEYYKHSSPYKRLATIQDTKHRDNTQLDNPTLKLVQIDSTSKQNIAFTSPSLRLKNIKNRNSDDHIDIANSVKITKTPEKVLSNEEKSGLSTNNLNDLPSSSTQNNDSFCNKRAMTASWVMAQPQDVSSETINLSTGSGNSLSVNINESTAILNFDEEEMKMDWKNTSSDEDTVEANMNAKKETIKKKPEKLKDLCIIVDTNVFISSLSKIKDIMNMKVTGPNKPVIYIPWMVLEELDFLKDSNTDNKNKKNVTNSIIFINDMLKQKHTRMIGQSVHDAEQQKYVGKSPDDKILACCIQVAEKYEDIFLVSNDTNLKNKAMVNDIPTCSSNEVIMKIMSKLSKCNKSIKIIQKLGDLCSNIICERAKEEYGDVWNKMDMLKNPPWPLVECLKRFRRYWGPLFREKLLKQCGKTVENLLHFLDSTKYICDDSEEFISLVKLCIELCIYLKDIDECRGCVEKFLNEIRHL